MRFYKRFLWPWPHDLMTWSHDLENLINSSFGCMKYLCMLFILMPSGLYRVTMFPRPSRRDTDLWIHDLENVKSVILYFKNRTLGVITSYCNCNPLWSAGRVGSGRVTETGLHLCPIMKTSNQIQCCENVISTDNTAQLIDHCLRLWWVLRSCRSTSRPLPGCRISRPSLV